MGKPVKTHLSEAPIDRRIWEGELCFSEDEFASRLNITQQKFALEWACCGPAF